MRHYCQLIIAASLLSYWGTCRLINAALLPSYRCGIIANVTLQDLETLRRHRRLVANCNIPGLEL
jgi:hypothetical protein